MNGKLITGKDDQEVIKNNKAREISVGGKTRKGDNKGDMKGDMKGDKEEDSKEDRKEDMKEDKKGDKEGEMKGEMKGDKRSLKIVTMMTGLWISRRSHQKSRIKTTNSGCRVSVCL